MHPARGLVPFIARPPRPYKISTATRAPARIEQIRQRNADPIQFTKFKIQDTVLSNKYLGRWSCDTPPLNSEHIAALNEKIMPLGFNVSKREGSTIKCGPNKFVTSPIGLEISLPERLHLASDVMMRRLREQEGWHPLFRADLLQQVMQEKAESDYQTLSAKIAAKLPNMEAEPIIIDITGEWANVIAWVIEDLKNLGYKVTEVGPREYNVCNETEGFNQLVISLY